MPTIHLNIIDTLNVSIKISKSRGVVVKHTGLWSL